MSFLLFSFQSLTGLLEVSVTVEEQQAPAEDEESLQTVQCDDFTPPGGRVSAPTV